MLAHRYELKFPTDAFAKERFLESASHGLVPDPHGENATYRVTSQYFDTADLVAYREKLDGERNRVKFRLRFYSIDWTDRPQVRGAFMEIKHRIDNCVFKERVALTDQGAEAILADSSKLLCLEDHIKPTEREKRSTITAIVRAASATGFAAVHVISYLREAWMGRENERLRVTFDSCCEVYHPADFHHIGQSGGRMILAPSRYITELKFDTAIPRWIRDVVALHGFRVQRFSKYAAGIRQVVDWDGDHGHARAEV